MSVCGLVLVLLLLLFGGRAAGLVPPSSSSQAAASAASCKLSEHRCPSSGNCIAQDRFCDGENDCADKSDEPVYCTPCNRTLYGDVGRTYELQVRRPREERLPFLCHLNFTAAGGEFGDLVQLTFDTFTVGRFQSFTSDGCPDGHMSIREEARPPTGGQWCGSAWGYTVYYSETRSINLTLYLSRLSGQGNDYNFDFKLSYKFLKRSEAHLRYGNSSMSTWRGELVNATYCDRVFTRCDVRACRLQSPNYPGVYPRNVTCYYRVEQKRAPPGHRALLAVSQRNSHKIHIKDQVNKYDTSQRSLRLWDQCNVVQDYLTVYDGGSTQDRVLVRLCGGDAVPDIVASKDVMLLEFHTSPYDNPFHPVPLSFLPGFELEVQVIFVDERSPASFVAKNRGGEESRRSQSNGGCEFYISSYENAYGVLENPKHSLPPNTTCRYHFQGKPSEIVWLAFVKYYAAGAGGSGGPGGSSGSASPGVAASPHHECNVKLLIWDGRRGGEQSAEDTARLMGEFCKDEIPRLCDHSLLRNASRQARPCSLAESYVSRGPHLTLEHLLLGQASALYPVSFVLRYEFVHQASSCDRLFRPASGGDKDSSNDYQQLHSPRNVFFYGRGGAQNLSCVYSFEPGSEHRLEIAITRASFGQRNCFSWIDPLVNRWTCERPTNREEGIAELRLSEYPWQGVQLPRDCLCSNLSERLVLPSLSSALLELSFTVERMNVTQDYEDFFFEAEFRFVPLSEAQQHDNRQQPTRNNNQQQQQHQGQQRNNQQQQRGHNKQQMHMHQHCHHSSRLLSDSPRLLSRLEERRLRGTSGEIALRSPPKTVASSEQLAVIDEEVAGGGGGSSGEPVAGLSAAEVTRCVNEPWLIEPEDSRLHFLYLKTPGFRLTRRNLQDCPTRNRIVVYPAASPHERTVVCPADNLNLTSRLQHEEQQRVVDLISGGWNRSIALPPTDARSTFERPLPQHQQQHARSFVVEFLQHEPGAYIVTWMAISKRLLSQPSSNFFGNALAPSAADCPYRCPELEACISSVLWCDGVRHCPSGFDEREENCSYRLGLTLLYVAVGAGALGIFLIFLLATGCLKYCLYRRRRLQRRHLQKKLPPQAVTDDQQRSTTMQQKKKKVQVLSVNQLNSPAHNNGSLEARNNQENLQQHPPPQQQQQQPRYANATFARIGRYPTNSLSRQHQQQQMQQRQHHQPRLRPNELDEPAAVDEFAAAAAAAGKENVC